MFGLVVFFFLDPYKKHIFLVFKDVICALKKHAFIVAASHRPDLV
jgi:hypothetical protein